MARLRIQENAQGKALPSARERTLGNTKAVLGRLSMNGVYSLTPNESSQMLELFCMRFVNA